jgi:hypothetical protein
MSRKCKLVEMLERLQNGLCFMWWRPSCIKESQNKQYDWSEGLFFNYCPNCGLPVEKISLKGEKV